MATDVADAAVSATVFGAAALSASSRRGRRLRGDQVAQTVGAVAGDFQIDGKIAAGGLGGFEIQSRHGEPGGDVLHRQIQVDILLEPVPTDNHFSVYRQEIRVARPESSTGVSSAPVL